MVLKIKKTVQSFQQWQLMLIIILLNFLSSYIFEVIATLFSRSSDEGFNENYSNKEKLILFVIVGPILETLLFQYAIIEFCKRKKMALQYCCLLSAFIFASMHLYNIFYFLYAFVGGLMFAYLYLAGRNKKNAILITAATHIIYNGIVYIAKVYFS
ncbi:CPBP family intramembrane glutamic endopeptidase [Flavobacterium sp. CLA17]|uniref:CPBP family intramembrane glutamic endopeptidase n=1 Tax=Flavobacterium sp. CLA17 TaxID=2724135 RepID=UPI0014918185|nr:CPBP family intramembrane glutamic endopeptidase [Flavobacterium sp. CLA17]QSB29101.1 CPBP family intramembrane metalloprotease [Flavobacterium sp. CLA17]